jgi:hypothetical protein
MHERMMILDLLDKGKVNVDEAVRLLEALGPGQECFTIEPPSPPSPPEAPDKE